MSGDPYIKENERLEAEIARLRSDLAVEKINNKRLQSERNNAEVEIAKLLEQLRRGVDTNEPPDKTDRIMTEAADTILRLQAALEEMSTYPVAGDAMMMLEIARKAKEGK